MTRYQTPNHKLQFYPNFTPTLYQINPINPLEADRSYQSISTKSTKSSQSTFFKRRFAMANWAQWEDKEDFSTVLNRKGKNYQKTRTKSGVFSNSFYRFNYFCRNQRYSGWLHKNLWL